MQRFSFLRPTDYVWLRHTYGRQLIYHTHADRADRPRTDSKGHEGTVAGWVFTICGLQTYNITWDDEASPRTGRFYIGYDYGTQLPLRLLNPDLVRPCRKCFTVDEGS